MHLKEDAPSYRGDVSSPDGGSAAPGQSQPRDQRTANEDHYHHGVCFGVQCWRSERRNHTPTGHQVARTAKRASSGHLHGRADYPGGYLRVQCETGDLLPDNQREHFGAATGQHHHPGRHEGNRRSHYRDHLPVVTDAASSSPTNCQAASRRSCKSAHRLAKSPTPSCLSRDRGR